MKNRAFTLIEVIAAMAIISIGLVSLLALFPTGIALNQLSTRVTKGTMLCREMMGNIKLATSSKQRGPIFPGENVPPVILNDLMGDNGKWYNFGQYYDDDKTTRHRLGFPDDDSFDATIVFYDDYVDDEGEYRMPIKKDDGIVVVIVTAYWPRSRGELSTLGQQQGKQRQVKLVSFIRYQQ